MELKEKKIEISVNQEDVQNIIDCYEKDIKYIKQLEKENASLMNALVTTRTKHNNDKARYRRKAKRYRNNWNELKECIKSEIERTNNIIAEDCNMIEINHIRKMINDDREAWLYKMQEIEGGVDNE